MKCILLSFFLLLIGFTTTFWLGWKARERATSTEDVKTIAHLLNISNSSPEENSINKNYLIIRFYLKLSDLDNDSIKGLFEDFGPPDISKLSGAGYTKNPVDMKELYHQLKKIHGA